MTMPKKPLEAAQYGYLTVLGSVHGGWQCACICGEQIVVSGTHLRAGAVKSCGCKRSAMQSKSSRKHGGNSTRLYNIWSNMKGRCLNENRPDWPNYGGRGIKVCDRWASSFEAFRADMGEPAPNQSLDRIDSNGNYEPENCQWAGKAQQSRNKRDNRRFEIGGTTRTLVEWCEIHGIKYWTVQGRLRRGWTIEDALEITGVKT